MENLTKYIILFVSLMLLQMLVLNNVSAVGLTAPYLYLAFILMLPVNTSPTLVLFLSFITGLTIDLSLSSLGVHSFATVAMAAVRPYILKWMAPRIGYERNNAPLLKNFGILWAIKYNASCVAIHHIVLYYCFTFSFEDAGFLFIRMVINIILTVFLIILSQVFIFRK